MFGATADEDGDGVCGCAAFDERKVVVAVVLGTDAVGCAEVVFFEIVECADAASARCGGDLAGVVVRKVLEDEDALVCEERGDTVVDIVRGEDDVSTAFGDGFGVATDLAFLGVDGSVELVNRVDSVLSVNVTAEVSKWGLLNNGKRLLGVRFIVSPREHRTTNGRACNISHCPDAGRVVSRRPCRAPRVTRQRRLER